MQKVYERHSKPFENADRNSFLFFTDIFHENASQKGPSECPGTALGRLLAPLGRLLGASWGAPGASWEFLEPLGASKLVKVSKKASQRPPKASPKGRQRQPRAPKTSQKIAEYPSALFLPPSCHFLAMFPCFSAAPMQLKSETSELQAQSSKPEAESQTLELKAKR